MGFTFQLIVLLGLSSGLLMGADAKCTEKGEVCPDGWTKHGERCYMFFNDKKTWREAESHCVEQGGNLLSLHTAEEADFFRDVVKTATGALTRTWLGSHDTVEEGFWLNSDGSKFDKIWGDGEPNNQEGKEHCMEFQDKEGLPINDANCDDKIPFICGSAVRTCTVTFWLSDQVKDE